MTATADQLENDARPIVLIVDVGMTVYGGVERVLLNVMPLVNRQWRVIYCDLWSNRQYETLLRGAGIEVLHLLPEARLKYIGRRGSILRALLLAMKVPRMALALLRLRAWIRRYKPVALYFNRWEILRLVHLAASRRIPKVYHSHGLRSPSAIPASIVELLNQSVYRTIAVSQSTLGFLAAAGVRKERLVRIYNAINPEAVRQQALEAGPALPAKSSDDVVFIHAGVINENKNQLLSIDAIGAILDKTVKLWICGDIHSEAARPYKNALERRVAELALSDRVAMLGWRSDVARVMAAGDVVILPSGEESFGMTLIEAMALGKPCIGTSRGGVPEVVADGRTGLVREPTPEAFAEAMQLLSRSADLRKKMGKEAIQRVEELFTLPRQAAEIVAVLDDARSAGSVGGRI